MCAWVGGRVSKCINEWMAWRAVPLVKESLGWKGVRGYPSVGGIKIVGLRAQGFSNLGNWNLWTIQKLVHISVSVHSRGEEKKGHSCHQSLGSVRGPHMLASCWSKQIQQAGPTERKEPSDWRRDCHNKGEQNRNCKGHCVLQGSGWGHGPQDGNSSGLWRYVLCLLSTSLWGSSGKILFLSLSLFFLLIHGRKRPVRFTSSSYLPPSRPNWNDSRQTIGALLPHTAPSSLFYPILSPLILGYESLIFIKSSVFQKCGSWPVGELWHKS